MRKRGRLFLILAAALAFSTFFILRGYLESLKRPEATIPVLIVKEPIAARTSLDAALLSQGVLEIRDFPERLVPNSAIMPPPEMEQDPTVLAQILPGITTMIDLEPGDILQANQLDQNAGLEPGMRAVSLAVNQVTSVGGTVRPGNWVDVIVSYEREDGEGNKIPVTELLLQDVEVLAVYGPSYYSYYAQPPAGVSAEEAEYYAPPQEARFTPEGEMMKDATVTLALTPEQALKLAHASNFAKEVRLMIRRLDDKAPVQVAPIISYTFR